MIHSIQRVIPEGIVRAFAGQDAKLLIELQMRDDTIRSIIKATATSRENLVRILDLYILELQSMQRDALRSEFPDA